MGVAWSGHMERVAFHRDDQMETLLESQVCSTRGLPYIARTNVQILFPDHAPEMILMLLK